MKRPSQPPDREKESPLHIILAGVKQLVVLCNNTVSILGILCFGISLFLMAVFGLFAVLDISVNRYMEAFLVLLAPFLFIVGLVLIPLGIFFMHRREKKHGKSPQSLEIQVKDRRFRGSVGILLVATMGVTMPVLMVSAYKMYHLTESTEFCGKFCHVPMQPQALAHARSPHARVSCAECHIGQGADFFVKAKLSGLRQIYAVTFDTFPRPIPPAITELRPARDTCEECHWPSKFFGTQYKKAVHYASDENNSRREVEMMVKTGGANLVSGKAEGIHMHMLTAGEVEYIATDDGLQDIAWVRYERKDGEVSVYRKVGATGDTPPKGVKRKVDCMDCHNRGAHHLQSPQESMDMELESRRIDSTLPYIVRESLDALLQPYKSSEDADKGISMRLTEFYKREQPEVWAKKQPAIAKAIERVQAIYRENFFPDMKADWRTYPENTGHQYSRGCFRCHDGLHADDKGRTINSDCTICHSFVNYADRGLDCLRFGKFRHPNSLSIHRNVLCSSCHGEGKNPSCMDCHKNENWSELRGKGKFRPHDATELDRAEEAVSPENAKDKLFRLIEAKDEWERTKPIRQIEVKDQDNQDGNAPPESPGGGDRQ